MNKLSRGLVVGAVTLLAAAPATGAFAASHASAHRPVEPAHGQTHRPVKPMPVVVGTVTALDPDALTVTVSRPAPHHATISRTFTVAATAVIKRNDAAATFADLRVGDRVAAKVKTVGGVLTAYRVNAEGVTSSPDAGAEPNDG